MNRITEPLTIGIVFQLEGLDSLGVGYLYLGSWTTSDCNQLSIEIKIRLMCEDDLILLLNATSLSLVCGLTKVTYSNCSRMDQKPGKLKRQNV